MFAQYFEFKDRLPVYKMPSAWGKIFLWCSIAVLAVAATLGLFSMGKLLPFVIVMGAIGPFFGLLSSKWMAKRAYEIEIIDQNNPGNTIAVKLVETIKSFSERVGLKSLPEIGVYSSDELNAFATGASKNSAMIAVSSSLLDRLGEREVAAILAHEVAHVANGDMVAMAAVQGAVNMVVITLSAPLFFIDWITRLVWDGSFASTIISWIIKCLRWVGVVILMFLGNLVVKKFSRQREFRADQLASMLVDRNSMVSALSALTHENNVNPPASASLAAFMIASPPSIMDIFSTHPSIGRRIARLNQDTTLQSDIAQTAASDESGALHIDLSRSQGIGKIIAKILAALIIIVVAVGIFSIIVTHVSEAKNVKQSNAIVNEDKLPATSNTLVIQNVAGVITAIDCGDLCHMTLKDRSGDNVDLDGYFEIDNISVGDHVQVSYHTKRIYFEPAGDTIEISVIDKMDKLKQ